MFHFSGRLSASAFAVRGWIAAAVFAATVFGFPFLQNAIMRASGCAGIGGACGVVGTIAALEIKPIFFYGFVAFLVGISVPRSRDLGLPPVCGLFLPLMVLADSSFGLLAGAGWAAAFAVGALEIGIPIFLLFALALMVFLSVAPTNSLHARNYPKLRILIFAIAAILSVSAIWKNLPPWIFLAVNNPRFYMTMLLPRYSAWLMIPLLCILTFLSWTGRRSPAPADTVGTDQRKRWEPEWKFRRAVMIAAIVTGVVFVFDQIIAGNQLFGLLWLLSWPAQFASTLVPTFLLYLAPTCAIMQLRARTSAASMGLLAASFVPFALWGYAAIQTYEFKRGELATLAGIPKASIGHVPNALVVLDGPVFCYRIRSAVPEITEIIQVSWGPRYEREDCASAKSNGVKREKIATLPDEYVRLLGGRDSQLAQKGQVYSAIGQPLELRYIAPGHDDLIAASYEASNPYPLAPPVLTTSGWLRPPNSAMIDDVFTRTHRFVTEALIQQRPPSGVK